MTKSTIVVHLYNKEVIISFTTNILLLVKHVPEETLGFNAAIMLRDIRIESIDSFAYEGKEYV